MYDVIVIGARCAGSPTAMLLARQGYRVLLTDRATFPSDTMSTHYLHQPGVACLNRWGVLDRVIASGCPPLTSATPTIGPFVLHGWGPACDGITEAYAPRRTVLDKILADAAVAAGAELREAFSVHELTMDGERVTGLRGHGPSGATVTEEARVVVGADGLHSLVARAVQAPQYNEKPPLTSGYYSYWSSASVQELRFAIGEGRYFVTFPTNDGLTCTGVGLSNDQFHAYRDDVDGMFFRTLEALAPDFAEYLRGGKREERWVGTADVPNFFRKPYGPGWALVGDAGYHKDPITGYGITDAFLGAEWLAKVLDAGLSGRQPLDQALAGYEERRNAFSMPMYELICQFASLQAPPPEVQALLAALVNNPEETGRFLGVLDGTVPVPEFFDPKNLERIIAASAGAPAGVGGEAE